MRPQQSFTFVSFTTGASGASILFGFLHALLCVFSAKVLAASFSFWIGRCAFITSTLQNRNAIRHEAFTNTESEKEFVQIDPNDLYPEQWLEL
ncbi:hypothetical protein DY000_02055799 [Brassica cretica]|uniref:Uncharacterized protein n=1 Tax=Brassica cretica TaxID=69181 RepID=A0ABQ7AGE7_BRACR|nr:hypothetical protein DY000_02055799 [Brassica cretica]